MAFFSAVRIDGRKNPLQTSFKKHFFKVDRHKSVEAQRQLLVEQSRAEELQRRIQELEDQLYSTNVENDAIQEKLQKIIKARDEQIRQYEVGKLLCT